MQQIEKLPKRAACILGVISGKGGVGKSTISVLLARALAVQGKRVGILDADITGPSIPRLCGVAGRPVAGQEGRIEPLRDAQGLQVVSVNMFLPDEEEPVIWRGPLLGGALTQFYRDTEWDALDYLVIDFPPGTADVVLTAFQQLPLDGVVVVATPQDFVSMIVAKSVRMAQKTNTPVLGLVENMGAMVCPECGKEFRLFGAETSQSSADRLGLPLLARFAWQKKLASGDHLDWDLLPSKLQKSAVNLAAECESQLQTRRA